MTRLLSIILLSWLGLAHAQSVREIEKAIADELALLVEQRLNKPALAKQLKLQYPITEPTITEEEIQLRIDAAAEKELATFKTKTPEEIAATARKRYPLYQLGDEVAITNRRGQTLRGTLRENSQRFVKLDDRLYSKVDLTEQSLLAVDEARNKAVVERYISNQRNIQKDRKKSIRDVLDGSLGRKLRYEAGYAYYRGRWMTAKALFERALVWKRGQLTEQYRGEVTTRVYTRFGYTRQDDQWVPPAEGVGAAIVATDQQDDFFSAPVETPEPPPPTVTEPIVAPELPVEKPKARDTVLSALKEQGAVENLPPSVASVSEPEPAPEPIVAEPEPQVFADKSGGAAPIDFAHAQSGDAQLAALHARIDALRAPAKTGGGALGLAELVLASLALIGCNSAIKNLFYEKRSHVTLHTRVL